MSKLVNGAKDEILLDVPNNLLSLDLDEYYMVKLCKTNADIVKKEIDLDPNYKPIAKEVFDKRMGLKKDFSSDSFFEVISKIAAENSTRTSKETIGIMADYLSNPKNGFLANLKKGEPELVDNIVKHLIKNDMRREKSLASKVCRYLNEWLYNKHDYTINDSVVRKILPYYLAYYKIDKKLWPSKKMKNLSYVEFVELFDLVNAKVPQLTRHQLDHLIWYSYKNDNIRSSIASSLALVI